MVHRFTREQLGVVRRGGTDSANHISRPLQDFAKQHLDRMKNNDDDDEDNKNVVQITNIVEFKRTMSLYPLTKTVDVQELMTIKN